MLEGGIKVSETIEISCEYVISWTVKNLLLQIFHTTTQLREIDVQNSTMISQITVYMSTAKY